jgi:DNA helicase-2/ATP-dependent DNA helicase PcrA
LTFSSKQYAAVVYDGNLAVFACPGAGKTRVIAGKVVRLLSDAFEDPRKIACITFTNGALEEIERRLSGAVGSELADRYAASTVHSFFLTEIVVPHCAAAPALPTPVKIATPESEIFERAAVSVFQERLDLGVLRDLGQVRRLANGLPSPSRKLESEDILAFWEELRRLGHIDYSGILYYAHEILARSSQAARLTASRFSWFVVDEYQDCNELVVDCLRLLHDAGDSRFFIAGDYDQAIYGFNGVSIAALEEFLRTIDAARMTLNESWRIPERVTEVANCIMNRNPGFTSACDPPSEGAAAVRRTSTPTEAIAKMFIPGLNRRDIPLNRAAIIASNGAILKDLYFSLTSLGIPVILCGDRIYRKSSMSTFLEALISYIVNGTAESFRAGCDATSKVLLENQLLLRDDGAFGVELFFMEAANGFTPLLASGPNGSVTKETDLVFSTAAGLFAARCVGVEGYDSTLSALDRTLFSIQQMPTDLTWFALSEHAARTSSLSLLTIHGSKGLEYEAAAVVSLNEGTLPFFACDDLDEDRVPRSGV